MNASVATPSPGQGHPAGSFRLTTIAAAALGLFITGSANAAFTSPITDYGVNGVATFSAGDGFSLPGSQTGGLAASATTDSSGRIYILYRALPPSAGESESHIYLIRLDASGVLDGSFPRLDLGLTSASGGAVALALDEGRARLYLVRLPLPADSRAFSFTVSALHFNGSADTDFGDSGTLTIGTDTAGPSFDKRPGFAASVDGSGRLVLAGAFVYPTESPGEPAPPLLSNRRVITYAITPAGVLDEAFNGSGMKVQSLPATPPLLSSASFGVASGLDGRILSFGAGLVDGQRYVGVSFSDLIDGITDTAFNGNGQRVFDLATNETPPTGQSNLTQLLFSRVLADGTSQFVGLTGRIDQTTFNYDTSSLSLLGIQLTRSGQFDASFSGDGVEMAPAGLLRSPPTGLFADGSIAAVFRASDAVGENRISVRVLEGFSGTPGDGGSTTGGTSGGTTTGGTTTGGDTTGGSTTGGTTSGGATAGGTTGGGTTTGGTTTSGTTTGGATTGGTAGGSTTGGTTTGGTTSGGATAGGTAGGSTTGGTTTGGAADGSTPSTGGGSFGFLNLLGLTIGGLLRRRRGRSVVRRA